MNQKGTQTHTLFQAGGGFPWILTFCDTVSLSVQGEDVNLM